MEEYISKTVKINANAEGAYNFLSDLSVLAQAVPKDQVENFTADADSCSFKVKGVEVGLRIVERQVNKLIKMEGEGKVPFPFFLWVQFKELAPDDTRLRLVVHAKLNFIMKAMLKGKIAEGLDQMADQIALLFNSGAINNIRSQDTVF